MTPLLGVVGGLCFALCGVPAAWSAIRTGRVSMPVLTPWLIFLGAVAMYLYLLATYGFNPLLAVNYAVEVGSWGVVIFYHYFPRNA